MEIDSSSPSLASLDGEKEQKRLAEYLSSFDPDAKIARAKQDEIENTIINLGRVYATEGQAKRIQELLVQVKPLFVLLPNAKTAKIVHALINLVSKIPKEEELVIELCLESIEWAKASDLSFLRQKLESKLASCYLETGQYSKALTVLSRLLIEIKRFDDKLLLVEVHLIESKVHHKLRNIAKAKASLTASRTSANAIYCPPALQAQIDMQAGILHAEEKDFKTAYSYFYECFEGFNSIGIDNNAYKKESMVALKYMLLCKIMLNSVSEVNQIITAKAALGYTGIEVQAMRAMANAHHTRSLEQFYRAKEEFSQELTQDPIMARHLLQLEDTLFEQNLCRIIEPFSCIEISHVAELINLGVDKVEKKLSQMILDKKLKGILDQGVGTLIVHDDLLPDQTYPVALDTVQSLNKVVDSLFQKALSCGV